MRSRYTAFARGDAAYLAETWHADTRPRRVHVDPGRRWVRLDVVAVAGGGLLDRNGFKDVWNPLGGMTAWKEAGLPTVDGAQPSDGQQTPPVRDEGQHRVRRPVVAG